MKPITPRVYAEVSASALVDNYLAIRSWMDGQAIMPMLKADAYGHGAVWAARNLHGLPDLYGFGVASLEEGMEIRQALGARKHCKLIILSGGSPWDENKGQFAEKWGLCPVISNIEDWRLFSKGGWTERLPYELKFNTGMNRLGLAPAEVPEILRFLKSRPAIERPDAVFTHLAMGENPEHKLSIRQREQFKEIRAQFERSFSDVLFHMANSAAIWNRKQWQLDGFTDVVRPGLALYGTVPVKDGPNRGVRDVLTLRARVVQVRKLKTGDHVGYGGTYRVKGPDPEWIATLTAGYADGVHRMLSDSGYVWLNGRLERILGRVSMDLTAVSCRSDQKVGDWAELIGPQIDLWAQAEAAKTIPYELLTSIAPRVERHYV